MKAKIIGIAFCTAFVLAAPGCRFHPKKNSTKTVVWKETIGTLDPHGHSHGTIYYQVEGIT